MSSTIDINVISLLVNDDFINYVVNPNLILKEMWEDFFSAHPDLIPVAEEAKAILLGESGYFEMPAGEARELEVRISEKCGFSLV
ncbi:MAG TPA: hypothetical protein VFK73_08875 [Paludibacter sp.]|nr:hypothetical protein [Paludibacter sp.]